MIIPLNIDEGLGSLPPAFSANDILHFAIGGYPLVHMLSYQRLNHAPVEQRHPSQSVQPLKSHHPLLTYISSRSNNTCLVLCCFFRHGTRNHKHILQEPHFDYYQHKI